ncbi:MAG: PEP-CTERM sorting domain-containing protein [Planctomycetota bacterium]|nr:MAG: PEP-CTERM sorting domain-containing protein [Planctomycetota bacterium]
MCHPADRAGSRAGERRVGDEAETRGRDKGAGSRPAVRAHGHRGRCRTRKRRRRGARGDAHRHHDTSIVAVLDLLERGARHRDRPRGGGAGRRFGRADRLHAAPSFVHRNEQRGPLSPRRRVRPARHLERRPLSPPPGLALLELVVRRNPLRRGEWAGHERRHLRGAATGAGQRLRGSGGPRAVRHGRGPALGHRRRFPLPLDTDEFGHLLLVSAVGERHRPRDHHRSVPLRRTGGQRGRRSHAHHGRPPVWNGTGVRFAHAVVRDWVILTDWDQGAAPLLDVSLTAASFPQELGPLGSTEVPEPAPLALLAAGALGVLAMRRRFGGVGRRERACEAAP